MNPHSALQPGLAQRLYSTLSPRLPGLQVEQLARVDSTNTELLARVRYDTSPCLMVAAEQTAGRGRQGKRWISAPGGALTFSMALPMAPQTGWGGLSLAVGTAVAAALDADGQHGVQLKWPNDVWLWPQAAVHAGEPPRKLAGILIETAPMPPGHDTALRWVVVGVGLNLETPRLEDIGDAGAPAPVEPVGWREVAPHAQASDLLLHVSSRLLDALLLFQGRGWQAFASDYARRDALCGHSVQLWEHGQSRTVQVLGVAADGGLRVRDAAGHDEVLLNAELSVRLFARPAAERPC